MKVHHALHLLAVLICCLILGACNSQIPDPPTPTAVPPTAEPPTLAPPTAAIVISSPTDTPEPAEPEFTFLPAIRSMITKNNVRMLRFIGELPGTAGAFLTISPDNKWLATYKFNTRGEFTVWNLLTGEMEMRLEGAWRDNVQVTDLFFLPDGVLVAHLNPIGGDDWRTEGRAQHWDLDKGEIIKEIKCYAIVYSQDGSQYALIPEFDEKDMMVIVRFSESDQLIRTITPGSWIGSVMFSPDKSYLVGQTGAAWQSDYSFWYLGDGSRRSILYDATCLAFSEGSKFTVILDNQDSDELGELVLLEIGNFEKETITRQADKGWGCPPVFTHSTDMVIFSAYNEALFYDALDVDMLWDTIGKYSSEPKIQLSQDHTILTLVGLDYNIQLFAVY